MIFDVGWMAVGLPGQVGGWQGLAAQLAGWPAMEASRLRVSQRLGGVQKWLLKIKCKHDVYLQAVSPWATNKHKEPMPTPIASMLVNLSVLR